MKKTAKIKHNHYMCKVIKNNAIMKRYIQRGMRKMLLTVAPRSGNLSDWFANVKITA